MNKKDYNDNMKGFSITDCIIVNNNTLVFVVYEDPDPSEGYSVMADYIVKYIIYRLDIDKVGQRGWAGGTYYLKIEYDQNEKKIVLVDLHGKAWENNQASEDFPLYELPFKDSTFSVHDLHAIHGNIYAVGRPRKLLKRVSHKTWIDLTNPGQFSYLHKEIFEAKKRGNILNLDFGFKSVDGFNQNNIYACGDVGDMWHYDGKTWEIVDVPSNSDLNKVLCANDGYVYVASERGGLLKGKDNKWEVLNQNLTQDDFIDLAWFKGILYVTTQENLYQVKNNMFEIVPSEEVNSLFSFHGVVSNGEILIAYNSENVLLFNGCSWETIVSPPKE